MRKNRIVWAVVVLLALTIFLMATAQKPNDSLYSYLRLSSNVAFQINARYVEEVEARNLVLSGIRGMINVLDPFSELLERKDYDRLQESTTGKYSGLGMTIMQKDGYITVVAPMEGTPAYRMGLRAGDKIIKIDGQSTKGMSTEEGSRLMRGPAGTKVTLTISREGVDFPLEYTIERAVIEIKTVPFYGTFIKNGKKLGYVRLARFGEEANNELETAFRDLLAEKVEGIIFDLRSNGGGLLDQAVKVANYLLPKGSEITSTKGRVSDQNRIFYATADPLVPTNLPLAVLVNEMSASASEIVAGAVQDWDRGVVVGQTTFGKGLVQQVYPLSDEVALKLTTAKWYIPSGRCIQKDSRSSRHPEELADSGEEGEQADSAKERSSASQIDSTKVFRTKGGRMVFGGGGVIPDITVEEPKLNALELNLERLSMFFDFSVKYSTGHAELPEDFEVTPQMIGEFRDFLNQKNFTYKSELEVDLERLENTLKNAKKADAYANELAALKKRIEADKRQQFEESLEYIKRSIKRDILTRLYGEKAVYRQIVLKTDPMVDRAAQVLTSPTEYAGILSPVRRP